MGHDMGLKMLCRFSSDQYSIDDSLPFIANILLANVFMLSGIAIVLCYVQVKDPYCND
jgi:ATP-binding cassette subfamily C (CFTR/MRP) protein 10